MILNKRYRILKQVGVGGMATVYQAEDIRLGRRVAIKMLHEGLAADQAFVAQFEQEAHSAANLTHPNIVTVHDIAYAAHLPFIVMEYVEGRTLKEVVRDYKTQQILMPLRRVLALSIQICRGIGYAHRSGLVHCDVKPQNVLVTADERVKVADFGIARAITATHHQPEMVWGTPLYFAPEQALGQAATPASDVYAIGVMMFEMLTNRLPFMGESLSEVARKHVELEPPTLREFNPHVPLPIEDIVLKVLAKEPTGRYRTAGQLGRILTAYEEQLVANNGRELYPAVPMPAPEPALPPAPPAPTTDWVAVGLGLTAVVALAGLIPLWIIVYLAWVM